MAHIRHLNTDNYQVGQTYLTFYPVRTWGNTIISNGVLQFASGYQLFRVGDIKSLDYRYNTRKGKVIVTSVSQSRDLRYLRESDLNRAGYESYSEFFKRWLDFWKQVLVPIRKALAVDDLPPYLIPKYIKTHCVAQYWQGYPIEYKVIE